MEAVVIPTFVGLSITAYLVKKFGVANGDKEKQVRGSIFTTRI
jgi:hypothetical protein